MKEVSTQTNLSVRVSKEDKKNFEDFCDATGMNVSVAVNMFIKAVLREKRLPFEIRTSTFNQDLEEALAEAEEMKKHPENYKSFETVEEFMEDLHNEV